MISLLLACALSLPAAQWTIMVYLDADNNLEPYGIMDVNKMEMVGSDSDMNIVVLVDRVSGYDTSNGDWVDTRRGRVIADSDPAIISSPLVSVGEKNMGDPATLTEFVNWAVTQYPAEHYAVILWNHGSGWRRESAALAKPGALSLFDKPSLSSPRPESSPAGEDKVFPLREVCYDDTSKDALTVKEVRLALEAVSVKPDILGFDACLMQMMEVAWEIRGRAGIMVGSEQNEPAEGWAYHLFLADLKANPVMTPAQLATSIVNRYGEYYSGANTQSAVNLDAIEPLGQALDVLAGALIAADTEWSAFNQARGLSASYSYADYRDLPSFLWALITRTQNYTVLTAAQQAHSSLYNCIVANHSSSRDGAGGLSIYLTAAGRAPLSSYTAINLRFAADTRWDDLLRAAALKPMPDDGLESNNTLATSAPVAFGSHLGLACLNEDWYRVDLSPGHRVVAAIQHLYDDGDIDTALYNGSGIELTSSDSSDDLEILYHRSTGGGAHHILAYGYSGATNPFYNLHVYSPDANPGYTIAPGSMDWAALGAPQVFNAGDEDSLEAPLGFRFRFYGVSQESVRLCSNGYLTLGDAGQEYLNLPMPLPFISGGIIAPLWDDLDPPAGGGRILYGTEGPAGDRRFIVTWENCPHWTSSGSTEPVTFQAILEERDHRITFQYKDVDFGQSELNGGLSATVGLQSLDGRRSCLFSYDEAFLENGLSLEFTPDPMSPAGAAWAWYD